MHNTAISSMMEWLNDMTAGHKQLSKDSLEKFLIYFSTMAPHMASELLEQLLGKTLQKCDWPTYDSVLVEQDTVTIIVKVNGKLRANIEMKKGSEQSKVEQEARRVIHKWLEGKEPIKVVFVPDRLINFVVQ